MILRHDALAFGRVVVARREVGERVVLEHVQAVDRRRPVAARVDHVHRVAAQGRVVAQRERSVPFEKVLGVLRVRELRAPRAQEPELHHGPMVHSRDGHRDTNRRTRGRAPEASDLEPGHAREDRRDRGADRRRRRRGARARAQGAARLGGVAGRGARARRAARARHPGREAGPDRRDRGARVRQARDRSAHDGSVRGVRRDDLLEQARAAPAAHREGAAARAAAADQEARDRLPPARAWSA